MKKETRHILIGSGILAAGAAAVSAVRGHVTKYLVKVALDRDPPKHPEHAGHTISGDEPDQQLMQAVESAADRLGAMECQRVEITGNDGVKLVGHWFPHAHAKRVIIAMHGWRSSWTHDFGSIADFWFDNSCSVLIPEQRGQGESGGAYMGFGLLERFDCLNWIDWVNRNGCDRMPLYLCGISMGATTVLMAAGQALPENVRGVIADCGFTSAEAIWKHVAQDNLGISYGMYSAAANRLCKKKIQFGADDYSTTDALGVCKVPVLLIHGDADKFVPVQMTYENYEACAAPKQLLIVHGANHGMSYLIEQAHYQETVQSFWDSCEKEM